MKSIRENKSATDIEFKSSLFSLVFVIPMDEINIPIIAAAKTITLVVFSVKISKKTSTAPIKSDNAVSITVSSVPRNIPLKFIVVPPHTFCNRS
jgi:hypothetical protein